MERRDVAVSETRGVCASRERASRVSTREWTVASRTTTDDRRRPRDENRLAGGLRLIPSLVNLGTRARERRRDVYGGKTQRARAYLVLSAIHHRRFRGRAVAHLAQVRPLMAPRKLIFVVNLAIARFTEVCVVVVAVDGGVGVVAQHARHHLGRCQTTRRGGSLDAPNPPLASPSLLATRRDAKTFPSAPPAKDTDGAFYGPRWIGLGNARAGPRRRDRSRTSPRLGFCASPLESRSARDRRPHLERQCTPRRAEWRMPSH